MQSMARTHQLNKLLYTAFPVSGLSNEMHLPMLASLYHLCILCKILPRLLRRLLPQIIG